MKLLSLLFAPLVASAINPHIVRDLARLETDVRELNALQSSARSQVALSVKAFSAKWWLYIQPPRSRSLTQQDDVCLTKMTKSGKDLVLETVREAVSRPPPPETAHFPAYLAGVIQDNHFHNRQIKPRCFRKGRKADTESIRTGQQLFERMFEPKFVSSRNGGIGMKIGDRFRSVSCTEELAQVPGVLVFEFTKDGDKVEVKTARYVIKSESGKFTAVTGIDSGKAWVLESGLTRDVLFSANALCVGLSQKFVRVKLTECAEKHGEAASCRPERQCGGDIVRDYCKGSGSICCVPN